MAQQRRPKLLLSYGRVNEPIRVPWDSLIVNPIASTYLSADQASASNTLTVQAITGFAVNQVLLIGEPGFQNSEVINTHASTAPSGSTITLAANTAQSHSAGTIVRVIDFDQVELSNATTLTGSKTVMATKALAANLFEHIYNDTTYTTGFYFGRYKNTISTTFSTYSDGIPVGGYTQYQCRYILDAALNEIGKRAQSTVITDDFLFQLLNNCQTEVLREQKRWQFMQNFNKNIGTTATGTWTLAVPTDLDDQYTNKSAWHFRIAQEPEMTYVDKEKWDQITFNVINTTLAATLNVNDTTMTLTNSGDFGSSGTAQIGSSTYSFTANNTSTNVLTLSTAVTTGNNQANGAQVFMNMSFGEPKYWTIYNANIYHYPGISSTYNARGYYLDYYKAQTQLALDTDTIVLPDQTVCIYYLIWKILRRLNNGGETPESTAAKTDFQTRVEKLKQKDSLGRTFRLKPVKNSQDESFFFGNDSKWQRVAGWYKP